MSEKKLSPERRKKIKLLWDKLAPTARTKVFHLKPTYLFVFNSWERLTKEQVQIVFKSVQLMIEDEIVRKEVAMITNQLVRLLTKHIPRKRSRCG